MAEVISSLTVIFIAAGVMLFIFERLSHPAIPAYILAGILVGVFIDPDLLLQLAQLGVAFLVFIFGMKMEPSRLREVAWDAVHTAVAQILVVSVAVYVVATSFGVTDINALYLGIAAALSSSLVGLELIRNHISLDLLHGRLAESVNLIQDIIAIFMIIAITSSPFTLNTVTNNLVYGAGFITAALVIRQHIAPRLAARTDGSRELMMLTGMTMLAGFLYVAEFLGLSVLVGAFAAGMSLAKFPYNLELLDSMDSLKDFFSAIFFVVIGALVTVPDIDTLIIAGSLVLVTTVFKPVLTAFLLVKQGYDTRTAYLTSMGLDHISEFALFVAIQAFVLDSMVIATAVFEGIILAATATMIFSSYTTRYSEPIYQHLVNRGWIQTNYDKLNQRSYIANDLSDHIILAGYGVQGKLIAEELRRQDKEFVVVDNDPEQITEAARHEDHYVFGNVMSDFPWQKAKAEHAQLIISTIPEIRASEEILGLDTDADIILRADNLSEANRLLGKGALYVDVPDITAADQLVEHVRGVLGDETYADQLRERNLEEIRSYFFSSTGQ